MKHALAATILMAGSFGAHATQAITLPEPGILALLGIAAVAGLVIKVRGKRRD